MKLLLSLFFSFLCHFSYSQLPITPKEGFFYGLNATGQNASDKLSYQGFVGSSGKTYQWGDFYASYFDKENYIKSVNDEFKRVPYLTQKFKELNEGIKNADFSKTFYFTVKTGFGTYNTDCGCFPLNAKDFLDYNPTLLDIKEVGNDKLVYDNSFAKFKIKNYANFNDFDYAFKIKSSDAEKFIESRKDNSGNISRQITLKVVYNLTKKGNTGITAYIHKIEFYNGSILLSSILPKFYYYDKVNLIKFKDKTDTVYFNARGLKTDNQNSAATYRIVNYVNGKIQGTVKVYYMSGKFYMEGNYDDTGDFDYNGVYTWFYENGQKLCEATYLNGVQNGKFISWYSNGQKKEEVSFINGKKDGCDYNWDEDGKCKRGTWAAWGDYADYYENGSNTVGQSKCPCIAPKDESLNKSSSNSNNVNATQITMSDLAGTYNGISESAGSTIIVNSDASVVFKINGNTFTGTVTILNTKEKDHESVKRKIKNKLNKDVEVTGYDVVFGIATNGQTKDAHFALLKNEDSIILWGGGDAFFEKKR